MRRVAAVFCVCLGFGALGAAQHVQTLNMSLDLVRLGIASRNLTPNDPTRTSGRTAQF